MSVRQIHVFISHAWAHSEHYEKLASWIFEDDWAVGKLLLDFRNYSVPKDDPIHNIDSTSQLRNAINRQIARSHVVVIPTAMYVPYSQWMQNEIEGAKQYAKPILAVVPRGQKKNCRLVTSNADLRVGWSSKSVINSIWELYCGKK